MFIQGGRKYFCATKQIPVNIGLIALIFIPVESCMIIIWEGKTRVLIALTSKAGRCTGSQNL